MTIGLVVIVLCAIALGLSGFDVIQKNGKSLIGWAVLVLAVAVLLTQL